MKKTLKTEWWYLLCLALGLIVGLLLKFKLG